MGGYTQPNSRAQAKSLYEGSSCIESLLKVKTAKAAVNPCPICRPYVYDSIVNMPIDVKYIVMRHFS